MGQRMAPDTAELPGGPLGQPGTAGPPVTSAEIIPSLQTRWPDIPEDKDTIRTHALYRLGPPLPGTPIPTGGSYRASRVWVILDLLLTSGTLREAITQTKIIAGS